MRIKQQEQNAKAHIDQWKRSKATSLGHVYRSYSHAKARAWIYCQELCAMLGGRDLKVITHSVTIFTAGFEFTDPNTGVVRFMYITPSYDVAVDM